MGCGHDGTRAQISEPLFLRKFLVRKLVERAPRVPNSRHVGTSQDQPCERARASGAMASSRAREYDGGERLVGAQPRGSSALTLAAAVKFGEIPTTTDRK